MGGKHKKELHFSPLIFFSSPLFWGALQFCTAVLLLAAFNYTLSIPPWVQKNPRFIIHIFFFKKRGGGER